MKVELWGTRGSLPASFSQENLREKLIGTIVACQDKNFKTLKDIEHFVDKELDGSIARTYGTNTSCVEIKYKENEFILCDCGTGIRDFTNYYKIIKKQDSGIFHLFISHMHWDHIQGFPFFSPIYNKGNKIIIHSHHSECLAALKKQMSGPNFPVDFDKIQAEIEFDIKRPGETFELDGFKVSSVQQDHPDFSYGYRFEDAEGKSVVYSTDCEHKENAHETGYPFVDFYQDADILIFDAMYSLADASITKANWGHSNNIMAVKLAARAKAKHLVMFHHEPSRTDMELEKFYQDTLSYFLIYNKERNITDHYPKKISLGFDGMIITA